MRELTQMEVGDVEGGWFLKGLATGTGTQIIMGIGSSIGGYFGQDNGGPQTWDVEQNQYVF